LRRPATWRQLLGTGGAYLALTAGYDNDLGSLSRVPLPQLMVILAGLPLVAATGGWLLAGRQPPALAVNRWSDSEPQREPLTGRRERRQPQQRGRPGRLGSGHLLGRRPLPRPTLMGPAPSCWAPSWSAARSPTPASASAAASTPTIRPTGGPAVLQRGGPDR
jgi:hypothetical protein